MRATQAAHVLMADGLGALRAQYQVPEEFPQAVREAAAEAARRRIGGDRTDLTDVDFVTLDPEESTDLDQAFALSREGDVIVLRYAIADVEFFVSPRDVIDDEAWERGLTVYLPDERAGLYPPEISEAAASLLPDGPRPAVVMTVLVATDGAVTMRSVERSVIRSRAKLAYTTVQAEDVSTLLPELAARVRAAEDARGASRVEFPEQEIDDAPGGGYELRLRPRLQSEDDNACMSLAANMAIADMLAAAGTGLFRVMDEPSEREIRSLRHSARALGVPWPDDVSLDRLQRSLDTNDRRAAALLLAVRRASGGARYEGFSAKERPWHAAIAATYCHATAPLRRLADRYVLGAAVAVSAGKPVPDDIEFAFRFLPGVMDRAETRAARIEKAAVDLLEAVVLHGREGQTFAATVIDIDDRDGGRIQLHDPPVIARVAASGISPGDTVRVRLERADPSQRSVSFSRA